MQASDTPPPTTDRRSFERALAELQGTLANFANAWVRESRVRAQYVRDISALAQAIERDIRSTHRSSATRAAPGTVWCRPPAWVA